MGTWLLGLIGHLYENAEHDHARHGMLIDLQDYGFVIPEEWRFEVPTREEFEQIVTQLQQDQQGQSR